MQCSDLQFIALHDLLATHAGTVDDARWISFVAKARFAVAASKNQGSSSLIKTPSHPILKNPSSLLDSLSSSQEVEQSPSQEVELSSSQDLAH